MSSGETVAELPGNWWGRETQGAIPVMKVFLGVASGQLIYKQEPGLVFEPRVRWHSRVMVTVFCTWAGARRSPLHKLESEELLEVPGKVTLCCQSQLSTSSAGRGWLSCLAFDLSVDVR